MKRKIAVTGASGFIGKNLVLRLIEKGINIVEVSHTSTASELQEALDGVHAVFHCAGVNRPDQVEDFFAGNVGFTQRLCEALSATEFSRQALLVYASTIQASNETTYGRSKREAEEVIFAHRRITGAPVTVLRLPNVFGKWCRPNYNSAIATFCHNIAHGLPITVHDPTATLDLIYIDDACNNMISVFEAPRPLPDFWPLQPVYTTNVGAIASMIKGFHNSRENLMPGRVGDGLSRCLYATYLSYICPKNFSYSLKSHVDERGSFAEILRTEDSGQFSLFTAHPGVTRGGHYHHTKNEKFLVVQGRARFGFRHMATGETHQLIVEGDDLQVVETVPGWSHDITNIGEDVMLVLLWANETFDPRNPDTIAAKVIS